MLEKFSLKIQLLVTFATISSIILIVISSLAINNISTVGDATQDIITNSLEDQMIRNMNHSSVENAELIQRKAYGARTVVDALAAAAEQLFSSSGPNYDYKRSYFDLEINDIPGSYYDNTYNTTISTDVSSYYLVGSTTNNLASIITDDINETISKSAYMDSVFKSLYDDYNEYAWLKIAFEEEKIIRQFPASIISTDRDYNPTQPTESNQEDNWYNHAKNTEDPGELMYTYPFIDPVSKKLIITVCKSIFDGSGKFIGVVAADLKLTSIQEIVDEVKFLDSGYASLILLDSIVIAHKLWDGDHLVNITKIEVNKDNTPAIDTNLLLTLLFSPPSVEKFTKDGEVYLISHAPVLGQFSFLIIVPEKEVIAGVHKIESNMEKAQNQVIASTVVVSLFIIISVLFIGLWLSNNIIRPIDKLNKKAMHIVSNVTEKDFLDTVELEPTIDEDDEISELSNSFTKMVMSLRDQSKKKK